MTHDASGVVVWHSLAEAVADQLGRGGVSQDGVTQVGRRPALMAPASGVLAATVLPPGQAVGQAPPPGPTPSSAIAERALYSFGKRSCASRARYPTARAARYAGEETEGATFYMARAGLFQDLDAAGPGR